MHLSKLHTPFSHIPSQRPLCCPHNGNPNTQERFFHANVKSIQEKEKYAVWDSPCAQRKQPCVKCLRRQPDILVPFNYVASSTSTWQIQRDVTSWSELNPTLPQSRGQCEMTNKTLIPQKRELVYDSHVQKYQSNKFIFFVLAKMWLKHYWSRWVVRKAICN